MDVDAKALEAALKPCARWPRDAPFAWRGTCGEVVRELPSCAHRTRARPPFFRGNVRARNTPSWLSLRNCLPLVFIYRSPTVITGIR
jgi:hypothetical protein